MVAGAVVAGGVIGLPVLSSGRLMMVVLLEDDGELVTTVVPATGAGPLERPSKRIAWPGRMVYGGAIPLRAARAL
ncbi:hypothetical protein D3C76_1593790 [compost metagenome]